MNRDRTNEILLKHQDVKLYNSQTPVLLSGYKSFSKPFRYRYRSDIIGIINARAYYLRTRKLMDKVIQKAKQNPHLLIK